MLIERRCYELEPGSTQVFWDAQALRPAGSLRPLLDRALGFFAESSGGLERIISLYAYEGFQDWQDRTRAAYSDKALIPYFQAVRPLIASQESAWMQACDAYPGHSLAARMRDYGRALPGKKGALAVDEWTLSLRPGSMAAAWAALRHEAMPPALGMFSTFTGELNRMVIWLPHDPQSAWNTHYFSSAWPGESVRSAVCRALTPAPVDDLSAWLQ